MTQPAKGSAEELKLRDVDLFGLLGPYLRPDWYWYLFAMLCAPASAALTIVQPWLMQQAIDDYITHGDVLGTKRIGLWFLAAAIAAFVAEIGYTVSISYGSLKSITRLRRAVYAHTLGQAQQFFDTRPTGRLLTRATSDIEALLETLTAGAVTIVLDVLVVLGILCAMFAMEWRLTLVMLLLAPVIGVFLEVIRRVLRKLYAEIRDSLTELNAFTAERLTGVEVVQLYSDEDRANAEYGRRNRRYRRANVRTNLWDALIYALMDGLSSVVVALLLWYGSGAAFEGVMTAGLLAAFIDYTGKLFRPIQEFSAKVAILQRASSSLEKVFGLLAHDERIRPGTRQPHAPAGQRGHIVLRDVSFCYRDGPDVLKNVSFEIRPGEVVALVGRTGSGKTTIGKLLTRTYDGYRGSISLDGEELRHLDVTALRRAVGTVRQDVQLFPGDVRLNVSMGAPLSDEALNDAISVAHATEAVQRVGGLDGAVKQDGGNLSVGEAQLLSFARTLAFDPPVVILDEATASVDSLTEARIQAATAAILERKTVLVVAHRLSTIVNAGRIVLLEGGRVVESGRHEELLAANGAYAELFRKQFETAEAVA